MAISNTSAIIAAKQDNDLRERAIAVAASLGIPNPQPFIEQHAWELASADVDDQGSTIASVYEYAETQATQKRSDLERQLAEIESPGRNPAAVTDAHLEHAVNELKKRFIDVQPVPTAIATPGA